MSIEIPSKRVEKIVEGVNKDEAMIDMINKLLLLYQSGAFDTAIDLLMTIKNVSSVITDDMVDRIALMIRELAPLIDGVVNSSLMKVIGETMNDVEIDKAILKVKAKNASLADVIKLSRDSDVINGLYIFLTIMKVLGRRVRELNMK
jgi:uncharacterized protein YjgD (DUF1641 family)